MIRLPVLSARDPAWRERAAWWADVLSREQPTDEKEVVQDTGLLQRSPEDKSSAPSLVSGADSPTIYPKPKVPILTAPMISLLEPRSDWAPPAEMPSLKGVRRLCVDVETRDEGLQERGPGFIRGESYIVGLGLGTDDGRRIYLPVRHDGGGNMDPDLVRRWAKEELDQFNGELCNAHIIYDLEALAVDWGVTFPNVKEFHDPLLAEPLLDEWKRSYSLDATASTHLGIGKNENLLREWADAAGVPRRDVKNHLWRAHSRFVGPYAEADVDLPLRLMPVQAAKLDAEGLTGVYDLERQLIPALLAMRLRGVRVDVERAKRVREELDARRQNHLRMLKYHAGPSAELRAPESFVAALSERGLSFPITSKTKKPSITDDWLKANAGDEMVNAIREGRKVDTIINTFIDGHILGHAVNGRIHAQFHQLRRDKDEDGNAEGAITGRFSSSLPNMQQIPARDKELAPMIRSMFLPEEGEDWQQADTSQIEYRLLVSHAVGRGAEEARERYRNDPKMDFHAYCGDLCGIDANDSVLRKRVKGINFAKGYGAQKKKLAYLLGCSEEEATRFIKRYERALPFAKETFDEEMKLAARQGYNVTIFGRRQRYPLWEEAGHFGNDHETALPYEDAVAKYGADHVQRAWTYTALNKYNQGSSADIMKKAMVDAWEAGVCNTIGAFLLTVHDELDDSIPRTKEGDEAGRELVHIMESCVKINVPILVDSKRGPSWGECE